MILKGLSGREALARKNQYGENIMPFQEKNIRLTILLAQFKSPLIYTLIPISAISVLVGQYIDAGLIAGVVVVDVIMGFFQEYSAQKTLHALKKILKPTAVVIRDSTRHEIDAKDIVPGDYVILGSGDKVAADGVLVQATDFLVHEAILTGEEEAITKQIHDHVFMGTTVLSGYGVMRVEKTGAHTAMGRIGKSLAEIEDEKTPIQIKLEAFARHLSVMILLICAVIFVAGILHHEDLFTMFKMAIILAIAATPQSLPVAITMILSMGTRRILKKHGMVKKLLSIETLGSTSVICLDKTGTITQGTMTVVATDFVDKEQALWALTLTNAHKSSVEIALWREIQSQAFDTKAFLNMAVITHTQPFDSEKKYSLVKSVINGATYVFAVGAPELLLSWCALDQEQRKAFTTKMKAWADEGLRLVGIVGKKTENFEEKKNFSWLGLVAITDPLRPEARETLHRAQEAGIAVKIVTGDYQATAARVAKNVGLNLEAHNMIDGPALETISEQELRVRIDDLMLFSRVTPHQKQKIVHVLQKNGGIVAMTGDGVNDAPALKKANIGIAVASACEVAKEAADLILLDNNFKTIMDACEEGRLIFSNIKKTVGYVLSNSFAEIILVFSALLLRLPAPLAVSQILWINLICDGPPDLMLAFEPQEKDLMRKKPYDIKHEEILSNFTKFLIMLVSAIAGFSALAIFWFFGVRSGDLILGRTLAFAILGSISMIYIFSYKDLEHSLFYTKNFFKNKRMFLGVAYGFALLFAAIYVPFLNRLLGTVPLAAPYWFFIFGSAIFVTSAIEITKKLWPH